MEIMANSDNVLRGGLTMKHIDVGELMKHTKFEATVPNVLTGRGNVEKEFKTPAADFELREIELDGGQDVELEATTAEVFFVYKGEVQVSDGSVDMNLKSGECLLATAGAKFKMKAENNAVVFMATVP